MLTDSSFHDKLVHSSSPGWSPGHTIRTYTETNRVHIAMHRNKIREYIDNRKRQGRGGFPRTQGTRGKGPWMRNGLDQTPCRNLGLGPPRHVPPKPLQPETSNRAPWTTQARSPRSEKRPSSCATGGLHARGQVPSDTPATVSPHLGSDLSGSCDLSKVDPAAKLLQTPLGLCRHPLAERIPSRSGTATPHLGSDRHGFILRLQVRLALARRTRGCR